MHPLGTNMLMVLMTGPQAWRINKLTDSEIQTEIMTVLKLIYGNSIPNPDTILVTRWGSDPLQFGSFANRPFGYSDATLDDFRAPIGRLRMAGEAYSLKDEGFVHGAYESGIETANEIIKCLRGSCSPKYKPSYGF